MTIQEKIKSFLKPSTAKIIISIVVLLYALYASIFIYPWGHSSSLLLIFLFLPLFLPLMFTEIFTLIFIIPYSYIIACAIVSLFNLIKQKRLFLIAVIVIFFFLLGLDEPLINTINKPDYSCSIDSDCVVKSISRGWCGNDQCVNQNWEYYDSMINSVFALSCNRPLYSCSCVENKCESKDESEDLYKSTNLEDCEKLQGYQKEHCITIVSYNIKISNINKTQQ